jgi:hypothetical protein
MPVEARAYPRPLPNPEWLGKLTEEIIEPDLPIIDPHHHLWDHPGSRYLLDELLADVNSGHNIVATVFIQCGSGYRTSGPEEIPLHWRSCAVTPKAETGDISFQRIANPLRWDRHLNHADLVTVINRRRTPQAQQQHRGDARLFEADPAGNAPGKPISSKPSLAFG